MSSSAADLLQVDFESERRRVGEGQIGGAWQIPVELVRRALRAGARCVNVTVTRARLHISDDGPGITPVVLESIRALLDRKSAPAARHNALVALETERETAFLALSGHAVRSMRVHTVNSGAAFSLSWKRGERPLMQRHTATGRTTIVELDAPWDPACTRSVIQASCRFANARITVDDRQTPHGFADAFFTAPLPTPVNGVLALVPRALAHVVLLVDGVVAERLTLTRELPFEAAVEMRAVTGGSHSPISLRESFSELEETVVAHAIRLLHERARILPSLGVGEQRWVRRGLLGAVHRSSVKLEALNAPLFPALVAGEERWLGLNDLKRERLPIRAMFPDQDRSPFLQGREPILLLDVDERVLLQELGGLTFRPPDERPLSSAPWRRRLRKMLRILREKSTAWRARRPAPDSTLTLEERDLLRRLRDVYRGVVPEVRLCDGNGSPRHARNALWIPSGNRDWRRGLSLAAGSDAWIYPLAVALLENRTWPANADNRWLNRPASQDDDD